MRLTTVFILFLLLVATVPAFSRDGETDLEQAAKVALAISSPKDILPAEIKLKIREKLERRIGQELSANPVQIVVDGRRLKPAADIDSLVLRLQEMTILIEGAVGHHVALELAGHKVTIERKILGEGITGVVHAVVGEKRSGNTVIKLPAPSVVGINAIIDESYILPYVQKLGEIGLRVAAPLEVHPLGLFSTKERAHPMNVTSVLLKAGILQIRDGGARRASDAELAKILASNTLARGVSISVMQMIEARKQVDGLALDLGPDNLHVQERVQGEATKLVLVDTGRSNTVTKAKIDAITTFSQFVDFAEGAVNRYIRTGVLKIAPTAAPALSCDMVLVPAA